MANGVTDTASAMHHALIGVGVDSRFGWKEKPGTFVKRLGREWRKHLAGLKSDDEILHPRPEDPLFGARVSFYNYTCPRCARRGVNWGQACPTMHDPHAKCPTSQH